ncbi:MAG TPA: ferredoxin--nitrite reductase [Chloroflexota bacterium]|nr:ferredoxin--nitrite reductase [Chloroflexota bacterium]
MNKFEEIKAARDGLDVLPDIERYAHEGWEAIGDDDKTRLKWYGLFFRKHTPGYFMLRIRIPNGIASAAQLRTMADVADEFGRGELDVTTRQQVQVRWLRIADVPTIFARLAAAGLEHRQTGMDNVRNVMGCPLAGLTTHELFDASPVVREYTARFVGNREFTNLPRKLNVAITGCMDNCLHVETQDVALGPALKHTDAGTLVGFNVRVGGKQGSGGFTAARSLDAFVMREQAAEVCAQITLLYRDHGPRETRGRARLAFLLDDWGAERFRAALEERLGYALERGGRDAQTAHHSDHLGVAPQRERGTYSVGLAVPVGRLSAAQLRDAAVLSEHYGRGQARFTPGQNLILTDVADSALPALLAEPLLRELRADPSPAMRGTVSCTGIGLCDLALADTKTRALAVARRLERVLPTTRPLAIHWSGCPAACGNHLLADIGLQGGKARVGDEVIEVYQVFVGGRSGVGARPATPVLDKVPAAQVGDVIEQLARAHAAGRDLVAAGQELAATLGQDDGDNAAATAA